MRPPGRQTRASSCATISWRGANWTPNADSTWSKRSSSNGRCSASPSTQSTAIPCSLARSRAVSKQLGSEVEADDLRAGGSCAYRDVPGTGRDVEHLLARRDLQPGEQVTRRQLVDHLRNRGVVSRGPGSSVRALEVGDGGHDCVLSFGGGFELASSSGSRGGHGRPVGDGERAASDITLCGRETCAKDS